MAFRDCCLNNAEKTADQVADDLGALMNASHDSCQHIYECSHPQLDRLVNVCREAGALGSRLTGAGWGGCCVSLVKNDNVDQFLKQVTEKYYKVEQTTAGNDPTMKGWLFATAPANGAICFT